MLERNFALHMTITPEFPSRYCSVIGKGIMNKERQEKLIGMLPRRSTTGVLYGDRAHQLQKWLLHYSYSEQELNIIEREIRNMPMFREKEIG